MFKLFSRGIVGLFLGMLLLGVYDMFVRPIMGFIPKPMNLTKANSRLREQLQYSLPMTFWPTYEILKASTDRGSHGENKSSFLLKMDSQQQTLFRDQLALSKYQPLWADHRCGQPPSLKYYAELPGVDALAKGECLEIQRGDVIRVLFSPTASLVLVRFEG